MRERPPRYASPTDVRSHAAEWPETFLECRLYGHVWRPLRATHHVRYRYYYVVQECQRCESERHSEITERGAVTAQWIQYTEGYLTKDVGRIVGDGRDVLRLAVLQRVYDVKTSRSVDAMPHSRNTRDALGMTA